MKVEMEKQMKLTIKHDDIEADLSYGQLAIEKKTVIHRYNYSFLLSQGVVQLSFERF